MKWLMDKTNQEILSDSRMTRKILLQAIRERDEELLIRRDKIAFYKLDVDDLKSKLQTERIRCDSLLEKMREEKFVTIGRIAALKEVITMLLEEKS